MKDFREENINEYTKVLYFDNGKSITLVDTRVRNELVKKKRLKRLFSVLIVVSTVCLLCGIILLLGSIGGYERLEVSDRVIEMKYISMMSGAYISIVISILTMMIINSRLKMEDGYGI